MSKKIINREFITKKEQQILMDWFYKCEPLLTPHPTFPDFRHSTALFNLPSNDLVTEIGERIIKTYGLDKYKYEELLRLPCFLSRHIEGGFVQKHNDPVEGKNHFRFNLFLSLPKAGGLPVYGSKVLNVNERDIVVYEADKVGHSSTVVEGNKPRVTIGYGWVFEKGSTLNYDNVK